MSMTVPSPLRLAAALAIALPLLACGTPEGPPPGTTVPISPASGLGGTSWQLAELTTAEGALETPADPGLYRLTFGKDGQLAITADCNQGSGLWVSTAPGKLTIGGVVSTLAACPEGSLSNELLTALESMTAFTIEGTSLQLSQGGNPPVFLLTLAVP